MHIHSKSRTLINKKVLILKKTDSIFLSFKDTLSKHWKTFMIPVNIFYYFFYYFYYYLFIIIYLLFIIYFYYYLFIIIYYYLFIYLFLIFRRSFHNKMGFDRISRVFERPHEYYLPTKKQWILQHQRRSNSKWNLFGNTKI